MQKRIVSHENKTLPRFRENFIFCIDYFNTKKNICSFIKTLWYFVQNIERYISSKNCWKNIVHIIMQYIWSLGNWFIFLSTLIWSFQLSRSRGSQLHSTTLGSSWV